MTGLEALKQVKNFLGYNYCLVDLPDELATIEKSLKALEIIKNKKVDVCELKICIDEYEDSLYQYNKRTIEKFRLTQDEFDTLKEVLE